MAARIAAPGGAKRDVAAAGLPPVGALHAAAAAAPPPPPGSPRYGLGTLDLLGLLTHPHLGVAVFEYFGDDTAAATALRGTCRELRDAVGAHGWHDSTTRIVWPARWRAAFPAATAANVSCGYDGPPSSLTDADFVHLRGVRELNMSRCKQDTITDAAFVHLGGIHTLEMIDCYQATISEACRAHLHQAGIPRLRMREYE